MPVEKATSPDLSRVTTNNDVCGGRPVIRGTRIRVMDILDMLAEGVARETILADFPSLSDADISAALAYGARATDHRVIEIA
jgi:uncharacterized protein (DUF433 family)